MNPTYDFTGQVALVTGGGSGVGIAALQNNTTDICNSSRKMKAAEIANDLAAFSRQEKEHRDQTGGNLNLVLQRSIDLFA